MEIKMKGIFNETQTRLQAGQSRGFTYPPKDNVAAPVIRWSVS